MDSTSGEFSWMPNAQGDFDVSIVAKNGVGQDAVQAFTISVGPEPIAPVITSSPLRIANIGTNYTYTVAADGTPNPTFLLELAPAQMNINSKTGTINWLPTSLGPHEVKVIASNGGQSRCDPGGIQ